MFYTANPEIDAARHEEEMERRASEAEMLEAAALEHIKDGLIEGLQWGPKHDLDLPKSMAIRNTSEAIYELVDGGHGDLIDRAVCLLAQLNDQSAQAMVQEIAHTYANHSIHEWRRNV